MVDLSSFYFDIIKDRLYCDEADSLSRRSAQTALYLILDAMTRMFAPILAFTCDEIWLAMPHRAEDDARNVLFNQMVSPYTAYGLSDDDMARWEIVAKLRQDVNNVLEAARSDKRIGKALEAHVNLYAEDEENVAIMESLKGMNLADILLVSECQVAEGKPDSANLSATFNGLTVEVMEAPGVKCPRCWKHSLASDADGLCPRCAAVMAKLPQIAE